MKYREQKHSYIKEKIFALLTLNIIINNVMLSNLRGLNFNMMISESMSLKFMTNFF